MIVKPQFTYESSPSVAADASCAKCGRNRRNMTLLDLTWLVNANRANDVWHVLNFGTKISSPTFFYRKSLNWISLLFVCVYTISFCTSSEKSFEEVHFNSCMSCNTSHLLYSFFWQTLHELKTVEKKFHFFSVRRHTIVQLCVCHMKWNCTIFKRARLFTHSPILGVMPSS